MTLPDKMKFKIHSPEYSKEVQAALRKEGFDWAWHAHKGKDKFTDAVWLFAAKYVDNCKNVIHQYHTDEGHEDCTEMCVHNGIICLGTFDNPKYIVHQESLRKPPIGLRPRSVVDYERSKEILEAMLRYVEANENIPLEWYWELETVLKFDEEN